MERRGFSFGMFFRKLMLDIRSWMFEAECWAQNSLPAKGGLGRVPEALPGHTADIDSGMLGTGRWIGKRNLHKLIPRNCNPTSAVPPGFPYPGAGFSGIQGTAQPAFENALIAYKMRY
jgi:hypothetical protein